MKKIILLLLLMMPLLARAQTYNTNYPAVQLTVTNIAGQNILLANGAAVTLYFAPADFSVSNNLVQLNTNSPDFISEPTNSTTVAMTNIVSFPFVLLTTNTITHSTNSTFGYGAGLIGCDTNYLYISVGTNDWSRIAIPTNTW
jgi:hypothetical protein